VVRPLFPHRLDWLKILAQRVVLSNPETILDATGVPFRAGMVSALFEHGGGGMARLETSRIFWGEPRSDSLRCSTDSEWSVVLDILRHAEAGIGVCRNLGVMVDDTCNYDSLLASEHHCWHSFLAVSCLGIIRRILELLYLAVE